MTANTLTQQVLRMKKYDYYIGIDPGVKTGFCVWHKQQRKFALISTFRIHTAMKEVESCLKFYPGKIFIRIEDARKRKWIPPEKNIKARVGRAKGAGSVCRDAQIWEDMLIDWGAEFEMVAPRKGMTKYTEAEFKKLTGYQGRTSEHSRDAALLVFGC